MLQKRRNFQNTPAGGDGQMQMHYSVANFVRADGVQCHPHDMVEGAPAPMVIIADPSRAIACRHFGGGVPGRTARAAGHNTVVLAIKVSL